MINLMLTEPVAVGSKVGRQCSRSECWLLLAIIIGRHCKTEINSEREVAHLETERKGIKKAQ